MQKGRAVPPAARTSHAPALVRFTDYPAPLATRGRASKPAWVRRHKAAAFLSALAILTAGVGIAAVLVRHDVTSTPAATAPDIQFLTGTGYSSINLAGFATVVPSTSGASATISLNGVAGAALTSLPQVMRITNNGASAHTITLARSTGATDLNAALDDFIVVIENAGTAELTWDAADTAASGTYVLPAGATRDITINLKVVDGTVAGAIGSAFGIQVSYAP